MTSDLGHFHYYLVVFISHTLASLLPIDIILWFLAYRLMSRYSEVYHK